MSLQIQYKKFKYEIKYLEFEKQETEDLFIKCNQDFEKAFRKKLGPEKEDPNKNKGVKVEKEIKYEKKIEELPNEKSSEVKKIYRRIVYKTHPDKLEKLPNNTIKKKLIKQYKDAVEKYNNNDLVGLFDIADELDIKLPEIDESYIIMMKEQITSLKDKIERYKKSNAWIWYHATGEKADNILEHIISNL
tara:strand:- start:92 stop:661 length:570 start_codon:yes stop_codon:yes gene_type:complete